MGLGEILDAAFRIYRANARTIIAVSALIMVPAQVIGTAATGRLATSLLDQLAADPDLVTFDAGDIAFGLVGALVMMLAVPLVAVGVSVIVSRSYLGAPVAVSDALRVVRRCWWALVAAWGLVHLLEGIGFLLCVLPAFAVMALFTPVAPVIAVEGLGPVQAMRRSARLVRRRFWPVLGTSVLAGVIDSVVSSVLSAPAALFVGGGAVSWVFSTAWSAAVGVVTTPFVVIVATLIYFDLRVRNEGFDLEIMAADVARRGQA